MIIVAIVIIIMIIVAIVIIISTVIIMQSESVPTRSREFFIFVDGIGPVSKILGTEKSQKQSRNKFCSEQNIGISLRKI